ncbi:MAG: hypothetical protein QXT19_01730 [Candidatus Woesearchaeota archaeon]
MAITDIANIPVLGALPNIPKLYSSNPSLSFIIDMVLLSVVFGSLLAPLGHRVVRDKPLGRRFGAVLGLVFGVTSAFALHNAGVTLFTYWLTSFAVVVVISVVIFKIMRALGMNKVWSSVGLVAAAYALSLLWFSQSGLWSENVVVGFNYGLLLVIPILIVILILVLFHIFATGPAAGLLGRIFGRGPPPAAPTPPGPAPPGAPPSEGPTPPEPAPPGAPPSGKRRSLISKIVEKRRPTPPGAPPEGPTTPERTAEAATEATKTAEDAGDAAVASEKEKEKVAEEGIELTDRFKNALMKLLVKIDELLDKTTAINKYDVGYVKKLVDEIIPLYDALSKLLGNLQRHVKTLQDYEQALNAAMAWHGTLERDIEKWKQRVREFEAGIRALADETVKARLLWTAEQIENKVTALGNIVNTLNPVIARINSRHLPMLQRIKVDNRYAVLYDLLTARPERLKQPLKYASSALAKLAGTAEVPKEEIREILEGIKKMLTPLVTVDAPKLRNAWEGISATYETELKQIQKDVTYLNNQYKFIPAKLNEIRRLQNKLVEKFQAQKAREEAEEKAEFEVLTINTEANLAEIKNELQREKINLRSLVKSVTVLVEEMNKEIEKTWNSFKMDEKKNFLERAFDAAKTKTQYTEAPADTVTSALESISLQHRRVQGLITSLPTNTPELAQLTKINANLETFMRAKQALVALLTNTRNELVAAGLNALSGPRPNLQQIVKEMLRDVANNAIQLLTLLEPPTHQSTTPAGPQAYPGAGS